MNDEWKTTGARMNSIHVPAVLVVVQCICNVPTQERFQAMWTKCILSSFLVDTLCPSSSPPRFLLTQLTGWHTFTGQSPWGREQKITHVHMHIRAQVPPPNHVQTHMDVYYAYTGTHTAKKTKENTHLQSPSVSCRPTLYLRNPYVSLTKQERALSTLWTLKRWSVPPYGLRALSWSTVSLTWRGHSCHLTSPQIILFHGRTYCEQDGRQVGNLWFGHQHESQSVETALGLQEAQRPLNYD